MCLTVYLLFWQRAAFLENDKEMEVAHSVAASGGDTEVKNLANISIFLLKWIIAKKANNYILYLVNIFLAFENFEHGN
mgnify:CR=1 FL=1